MKLLRWAVAGASVYAVYKYSIGKDATGENVIVRPEREIEKLTRKTRKNSTDDKTAIKPIASAAGGTKPSSETESVDTDSETTIRSDTVKAAENS